MEKPFGTDLESAVQLNRSLHEVFSEEQIFRIDHFLGKEPAQNILAFRFANGLFEPIWNRNFIDHVQIDVPETIGLDKRSAFYEATGAYRDMVVTHLFQILAFMAMEPPTALEQRSIGEEKNKVFRSMLPIDPANVVRGQYTGYRGEPGVHPESDTETFIALKCHIDNWRWAGVPFYLRTGKCLAEGQRIISIAFREPPKSMFPKDSGVGAKGPDHLTFDLADVSKLSLSFYGKRPGPGMKLDKLSLQFAMHDTSMAGEVLEAYERLILDAMRGDHTLFTTAEGIERLWEVSTPLLESPPPVRMYAPGSWGPNAIHQMIAPHAWRLPFERIWRDANLDRRLRRPDARHCPGRCSAHRHDACRRRDCQRSRGPRGLQACVPRQPVLQAGQVSRARDADGLLPGAGLRGARPAAASLDQHGGRLHGQGLAHGGVSVGRVPDGPAPGQQPHQPRHVRHGARRDRGAGPRLRQAAATTSRSRASATAAWGAWRPASSIRWRRWRSRRSAMASATSSASSTRRSSTAGSRNAPTTGCASAIPGRSCGRSGRWR